MEFLRFCLNCLMYFVFFVVVGQVRFKGQTLETRLHQAVNTEKFQGLFQKATKPVVWTGQTIRDLFAGGAQIEPTMDNFKSDQEIEKLTKEAKVLENLGP